MVLNNDNNDDDHKNNSNNDNIHNNTYLYMAIHIVYVIESAAYRVLFTSCLCQKPKERGTSE